MIFFNEWFYEYFLMFFCRKNFYEQITPIFSKTT